MSIFNSFYDRSEAERKAERKRIKLALAERQVREKRRNEILQKIADIDAQADAATDEHEKACSPIQAELDRIATRQIEDVAERRPQDESLESRRLELLGELSHHNEALEEAVARAERLKRPLEEELRPLTKEISQGAALQYQLQRTAPFEHQHAAWAASRGLKIANERLEIARANFRAATDDLSKAVGNPSKYEVTQFRRRHGQWAAELSSAEKMLTAARAESEEAQLRLDED